MRWKKVDPLPRFRGYLEERNVSAERLDQLREEARHKVDEAVEFALNSPLPGPESVHEGMFAELQ